MTGFFITFEGGEGSGKSTQVGRLAERLRTGGSEVITTREPGGSEGAEAVRHVILSGAAAAFGGDIEAILFAAARADHVARLIKPALERGCIVICDRFQDSTRVYQGVGGTDRAVIDKLEEAALGDLRPDLTVVLDVPAAVGLRRAAARRGAGPADRFEREDAGLHERRREAFLRLADAEPQRCVVVNGERPADDVAREIAFLVEDRLDSRRLERSVASLAGLTEPGRR